MRRVPIVLLTCLGLAMPVVVAASTAASASPVPASAASSAPSLLDVPPPPGTPQKPASLPNGSAPSAQITNGALTATCNSGYVCIYKGDIWDDSSDHAMIYRFYYYGTYNVQNLIGDYTVLNCQTGGAGAEGFTGYNGAGSVAWNLGNNCGSGFWTDLTSTYSVRLYP
jgi:hypothetical protein